MYDNGYVKLTALRRDAMLFFPNASHWAELLCPFRAFTAVSYQYSACVIRNCLLAVSNQDSQQINESTTQRPQGIQGLEARIISAPSRKGGGSMPIPWLEGCKPDIIVSGQYSAVSQQINMSTNQQLNNLTIHRLCEVYKG